ncbi:hypothetical protein BYT27DRAFT_7339353 [Phlegmacium glaucopus]|nr:hypothetical protein BYT27DRAFT_7339353 [Phlegmacium glaucopus]
MSLLETPVTSVVPLIPAQRRSFLPFFGGGSDGYINSNNTINNTNLHFYGPQFIVDSDSNALSLSLPDKKLVMSQPFHGGLNQQWLVQDDGNGGIALMSRYNRTYVAPDDAQGTILVLTDVPFWFESYLERTGNCRLVAPNTNLGINLSSGSAGLVPLSRATGLYILLNTPKSQQVIIRGQLQAVVPYLPDTQVTSEPDQVDSGTNINMTINNLSGPGNVAHAFTSNGTKNLVINIGHLNSSSSVSPKTGQTNRKLVISQSLPFPTAHAGTADIIGFGVSGVSIVRNGFNVQKCDVLSSFGYDAGGWRIDKHVRLLADTTGDKHLDIVGFGETGVWVSRNNGDGTFQKLEMVLSNFAYAAGGWRVEQHLRFMADIRNTGRADIVGFGNNGVLISLNNGDGTFAPPKLAATEFGYRAGGWRVDMHPRFLADVNRNGLLDIVGFGDTHVYVGYNNGDGTFQPGKPVLTDLCYSKGWRVPEHPRFVVDMTGDGKPDLVGFADDGVYVAFNNGDGTFRNVIKVSNEFCRNVGGWVEEKHPRLIADLTGDGCGDIVGFGEGGVYVGMNNGNGTFQSSKHASPGFGFNNGWRVGSNPRFVVDLTGNGRADILGFANAAVHVAYNDGKGGFGTGSPLISDFGIDGGAWSPDKTLRYVANIYG